MGFPGLQCRRSGVRDRHLPLRFLAEGRFFPAAFDVFFAAFLGDFLAAFAADFWVDDDRLPLKMFSQLSEYRLVAPRRTTLMANKCSYNSETE